jgi:hypothetical protein
VKEKHKKKEVEGRRGRMKGSDAVEHLRTRRQERSMY